MTATVIETALAGGGGLVRTLRHSYSTSDLRGIHQREEELDGQYVEQLGDRLVPRSWHEDSGYQQLEKEGKVKRRAVRGRSKLSSGSALSLISESEVYGSYRDERRSSRRRKTSSL